MADELLRRGLQRLQDRFSRAIETGAPLKCCLLEHPIQGGNWQTDPPPEFAGRKFLEFCAGDEFRGTKRATYIFGTPETWDSVKPIFRDAGILVPDVADNGFPLPPSPALKGDESVWRWVYVLFNLATARIAGSPLRLSREKSVWHNHSIITLAAWARRAQAPAPIRERFDCVADPPTWYSVIDDLGQASVYALDIMLEAQAPPPADPMQQKAATLRRVADMARNLYTFYQQAAEDLVQAKENLRQSKGMPIEKKLQGQCDSRYQACENHARNVSDLWFLVKANLPRLKRPQFVSRKDPWHTVPGYFDWDGARAELATIEEAARAEADAIDKSADGKAEASEVTIAAGSGQSGQKGETMSATHPRPLPDFLVDLRQLLQALLPPVLFLPETCQRAQKLLVAWPPSGPPELLTKCKIHLKKLGDPEYWWGVAVREERAAGVKSSMSNPGGAVGKVTWDDPTLHREYLLAMNPKPEAKRLVEDKFRIETPPGSEEKHRTFSGDEVKTIITELNGLADALGQAVEREGTGGTGAAPKKTRSTKTNKTNRTRGRPVEEMTIQRREFAKPLRTGGQTWEEITIAYRHRYPSDLEASADTIRLAYTPKRGRKNEPK